MEWHGIDLSLSRQVAWAKKAKLNFIKVLICVIISSVLGLGVVVYNKKIQEQYNLALEEYKNHQKKIDILNSKINKLKKNVKKEDIKTINHHSLQNFLNYIKQFQVSGVIETISLYKEQDVLSRIAGKLHNQSEFQMIEQQLKQINFTYQVEQYQTNEKQQIEFTILIKLGE